MRQISTIDTDLFIKQAEIKQKYVLSYSDSMTAASALTAGSKIISDNEAFDRVPDLKRIPLK